MTTILRTPRSTHFPSGMSNDYSYPYSDLSRAVPIVQAPTLMPPPLTAFSHQISNVPDTSESLFDYAPNSVPLDTASCPPEGASFPVDFETDLSSSALPSTSHSTGANDFQISDSSLSFPALPASLLDEAPEYEFSAHTRMNVFEAPQTFTDGLHPFALDANGAPFIDGASEYGLWSTNSELANSHAIMSTDYAYKETTGHDGDGALDRPESLPRTADFYTHQYVPAIDGPKSLDTNDGSLEPQYLPRATGQIYQSPNSQNDRQTQSIHPIQEPTHLPPTLLHSTLASNTASTLPDPHRPTISSQEQTDSQLGPSRSNRKRPRESPSAQNSPYQHNRPAPYPQPPSISTMRSSSTLSTMISPLERDHHQQQQQQLRRYSDDRVIMRDPVVPTQVPGRARLMSWQSNRTPSSQANEWQNTVPEAPVTVESPYQLTKAASFDASAHPYGPTAMTGYPDMPASAHRVGSMPDISATPTGVGAFPWTGHPGSAAVHPAHSELPMPHPHRGFGYAGHIPHHPHGVGLNANDMINALGEAMDASIDLDGIARCPYPNCNKTFAKNRSYNLKAHLRSHSQLKPFACAVCPRAFSRKHDLERHARVHSGDKPYVCEICNKGFPRSDALRRHWRVEKECGEKAAQLEAGQPLSTVLTNDHTSLQQPQSPPSQSQPLLLQQHQQHQQHVGGLPTAQMSQNQHLYLGTSNWNDNRPKRA